VDALCCLSGQARQKTGQDHDRRERRNKNAAAVAPNDTQNFQGPITQKTCRLLWCLSDNLDLAQKPSKNLTDPWIHTESQFTWFRPYFPGFSSPKTKFI
jgi:hypothetical protein